MPTTYASDATGSCRYLLLHAVTAGCLALCLFAPRRSVQLEQVPSRQL